jgi:hypothetical protein
VGFVFGRTIPLPTNHKTKLPIPVSLSPYFVRHISSNLLLSHSVIMVAITQFIVAGVVAVAVQGLPSMPTYSTAVSATARFKKLLTEGGAGQTLLTGDALKKEIVFPFKPKANSTTAKGGVAVAAVSCLRTAQK